ncbi:hypothetical protein HGA34_05880, partial [Candidatus Falkowbacteria bacterium]|nr:hypothetical protein [Candidatus Falkowbacteria bacterium]
MLKIFQFFQSKVQQTELRLAQKLEQRLNQPYGSSVFYFGIIGLNIYLVFWQIALDVLKFFIVLFADPGNSFNLFFRQRDLRSCPFSYASYKNIQKQVRMFSLAGVVSIVLVAVSSSLVTNLLFGGKNPTKAAAFGWSQSSWSGGASTTAKAQHKNPDNKSDWNLYSSKDVGVTVTGSASGSIQLLPVISTTTQTSLLDFNAGTNALTKVAGNGNAGRVELSKKIIKAYGISGFAGIDFSVALRADGTVWTWGYGYHGDGGNLAQYNSPRQVPALTDVVDLAQGFSATYVMKSNGEVWAWGKNDFYQLAVAGANVDKYVPTITLLPTSTVALAAGNYYGLALQSNGEVLTWGRNCSDPNCNGYNPLAQGPIGNVNVPTPTTVKTSAGVPLTGVTSLSVAYNTVYTYYTHAISNGEVWTWGTTDYAQRSFNTITNAVSVVGGNQHAAVLTASGTVFVAGINSYGVNGNGLDNGSSVSYATPFQVPGIVNAVEIKHGLNHVMALQAGGTVKGWGRNNYNQIGNGTTSSVLSPITVPYLADIIEIGGIDNSVFAVASSGQLFAWGRNNAGQLGDNSTTQRATATPVYNTASSTYNFNLGQPYAPGIYTSSVIDLGHRPLANTVFLSWDQTLNGAGANAIQFLIATSTSPSGPWTYAGVAGAALAGCGGGGCYTASSFISNSLNAQYIRYKAYLQTSNQLVTPSLDAINLSSSHYPSSSSLTSSWYNTTDSRNIISGLSWVEDTVLPSGTQVKFQLRTAATDNPALEDNQESPSAPSDWYGPGNSTTTHFTSSSIVCNKNGATGEVVCQIDNTATSTIGDGINDQWMQYRVILESAGDYTPTVDDVNIQYVVNNPPEIETGSFTAFQSTTTSQVEINYAVRDMDTDSGTSHPGFVDIGLEYWNGASWVEASSSLIQHYDAGYATLGTSTISVATSTYTTYHLAWTATAEAGLVGLYNSSLQVRISANDGEPANFLGAATTSLEFDAKIPVTDTASFIVVPGTDESLSSLYFNSTDDMTLVLRYSADPTSYANYTDDTGWINYSASTTVDFSARPDTLYLQFRDTKNNRSAVLARVLPATPKITMIQDTSNLLEGSADYRLFISWKLPDEPDYGFDHYNVYRSYDQANYTQLATFTPRTTNFYTDLTMASGTPVYYKVSMTDQVGNVSYISNEMWGNANGTQDAGEGGGGAGTKGVPPAITNVTSTNIYTDQATINWVTDVAADSFVYYQLATGGDLISSTSIATAVGMATLTNYDQAYADANGKTGALGLHTVILSGLSPNTTYYYAVKSSDPKGDTGTSTSAIDGYSFTTAPGPIITHNAATDNVIKNTWAQFNWETDQNSNSYVTIWPQGNPASSTVIGQNDSTQNHSVTVYGLNPGSNYHYFLTSDAARDDNVGANYLFTTATDGTPPVIISLTAVSVAETTAAISWLTNELATTTLRYGTASGLYSDSIQSIDWSTGLATPLSSLTASTTYFYQLEVGDQNGNIATSGEQSFTTLRESVTKEAYDAYVSSSSNEISNLQGLASSTASSSQASIDSLNAQILSLNAQLANRANLTPAQAADLQSQLAAANNKGGGGTLIIDKTDKVAPVISNIAASNIKAESAEVGWTTNESADGFVRLVDSNGVQKNYGNYDLLGRHQVILDNLVPEMKYVYKVASKDAYGNLTVSPDQSFTTPSLEKQLKDEGKSDAEIAELVEQAENKEENKTNILLAAA